MCRSLYYYPLVYDCYNDKQKILFKQGFQVKDRNSYDMFIASNMERIEKSIKDRDYAFIKWVNVPCGCCDECLNDRARQWAYRILVEAAQYKNNWFITLTYDDDHLPSNMNLVKTEISDFNKKLKTYMNRKGLNSDFRFYGVGEYGSRTARPHYHEILFNCEIPDLEFYKRSENGDLYYNSEFLNSVWNKGYVVIARVDIGSACYVARYCDKKKLLTKKEKEDLYSKGIVPEFSVMSRRPGIGAGYYEKIVDNVKAGVYNMAFKDNYFGIPRFYTDKLKKDYDDSFPFMKDYLDIKKMAQVVKISKMLYDSDRVSDIEDVLDSEKKSHIKYKKERDILF